MEEDRQAVLGRLAVAFLRASLWSALAGALMTLVLWLRTSPELRPGFTATTWFGLLWALTFVPCLGMELGVAHLLLDLGADEPARHLTKGSPSDAPPSNELQRTRPAQAIELRR